MIGTNLIITVRTILLVNTHVAGLMNFKYIYVFINKCFTAIHRNNIPRENVFIVIHE